MAAGLDPGSQDGKHGGIRPRHIFHGDRGDGGGAHLGDEAAIHHSQERAGLGVEQQDAGTVSGQAARLVRSDYGHQLGAQHGGVPHESGHGAEEGHVAHFEDRANGLLDCAARKGRQGMFHGADQVGHGQYGTDIRFVQTESHGLGILWHAPRAAETDADISTSISQAAGGPPRQ